MTDLFIYHTNIYDGLAIELKAKGRKVISGSEQEEVLMKLSLAGYCARVIDSFESFVSTVDWYFSLDKDQKIRNLSQIRNFVMFDATEEQLKLFEEQIRNVRLERTKKNLIVL